MHAGEEDSTLALWCNACMHEPSRQSVLGIMSVRLMLHI